MRKVSAKRKSGRKSAAKAETEDANGVGGDHSETEEGSSSVASITNGEPSEKKKRGRKRKSEVVPETADVEADEQYEVEAILDDKVVKGVKYYLVRWKGYEKDSDTWEPITTLNCKELIREYKAKSKSSAKKRKSKESKQKADSETEDENAEYEIDKILEVHHKRDGSREFLVSWKGYPASENTWEPEENLTCPELIAKFMEKVEKAKTVEARELREHRMHTNRFTLDSQTTGRRLSKRNKGKQRVQYHDAE